MKRRLITSALPYINNVPHLGNLIQVLSADAFARFCRLRGYETLYICGTDEYGTATETRAAEEGVSPQELCDRYYAVHAEIYRWFSIAFDKFGRTSTPIQTEIVQDIFKKLDERGYILERGVEQLYCGRCERFLADRYVRGLCPHCGYAEARGDQCESCGKLLDPTDLRDPRCSSCASTPSLQPTRHLYLDLPGLRGALEEWVETASVKGFWANNAVQMTYGWIKSGLRERAITRDLKWGIPVPKPGYEGKVFYVWFDACIGYISITGNYGAESSNDWAAFTNGWWKNPGEVELFQFIGKDNIPFHTVIFPASLLGTGGRWTMLHHLSSTEYLNYEGGKFSKSKGVGVFGTDVMAAGIGPDVWRFYIFYNRPEKADALFAWKDFQEKVNGELIGNLGNLVNRTLTFIVRYYNGKIPGQRLNLSHDSVGPFWERVRKYEADITEKLERAELRDAFRSVFELSSFANKAFQDGEPWKKRREAPHEAELLIRNLAYVVRDLAVLIAPFMPAAAERILSFFGLSLGKKNALGIWSRAQAKDISWDILGQDRGLQEVVKTEVLFPKLEDPLIDALRERYSGGPQDRDDTAARFQRLLDIRAARIVKVERHPKADKLYIETLEIAGEERVIVSGLAPYYTEAELLNKRILVVYNLKSAKIRGVESRGMLLAASASGEDGAELVEALDAGDAPTGARAQIDIGPGGLEPAGEGPKAEISIDEFFSLPLEVRGHTVFAGGRALTLLGKAVRTKRIGEGKVR